MYTLIICSCGRPLADIRDLFEAMCRDMFVEKMGKDFIGEQVSYVLNNNLDNLSVGDIFTTLNLHVDCCRKSMLTNVEFVNYCRP